MATNDIMRRYEEVELEREVNAPLRNEVLSGNINYVPNQQLGSTYTGSNFFPPALNGGTGYQPKSLDPYNPNGFGVNVGFLNDVNSRSYNVSSTGKVTLTGEDKGYGDSTSLSYDPIKNPSIFGGNGGDNWLQAINRSLNLNASSPYSPNGLGAREGAQFVSDFYSGGAIVKNTNTLSSLFGQNTFSSSGELKGNSLVPDNWNKDNKGNPLPLWTSRDFATGEVTYKSGGYNTPVFQTNRYSTGWQNSGGGISGSYSSGWINVK